MLTGKFKTKAQYLWVLGLVCLTLVLGALWSFHQTAEAQDINLLVNGSLEQPYYGQGASTRTVPQGWSLWIGAGAPSAFPHTDRTQVRDGSVSWNVNQGYTVFTVAGYQRVGGFTVGEGVRLTAYGWAYTCNDTGSSCVINEAPYRKSDTSAGISLKVGIDPNGGTDPNSANVQWSSPAAPYDQWAEMSVTTATNADTITVFLYMTQSKGLAINNVYWDQASLVRTTAPGVVPGATPTAQYVPFVAPQGVRPDGSIVHVVQAGDTLSSIAYAYNEYGITNESIAALNPGLKPNSRFLQLGQEIIILPPGSVDPATGQLIAGGDRPVPTSSPTPTTTPAEVADAPMAPTAIPPATDTQPLPATTADCPDVSGATYSLLRTAYFPFEQGFMFWLEDTKQIYVLTAPGGALEGTYSTYIDTWQEGMPETDSSIQPPSGLTQPDRSFGQAWRTYPGVRDALGWGTGSTIYYTGLVVRDGEKLVVNGPDNRVYELEGGTWRVVDYYAS